MKQILMLLVTLTIACNHKNSKPDLSQRLTQYGKFMVAMKPDSLAGFYMPTGSLSGENEKPIIGPKSISKHLKRFTDFNVLVNTFKTDSTYTANDTVFTQGSYFQKVVIPSKDTLELGGKVRCKWVFYKHTWMLQSMYTYNYQDLKKR
jgi:hypothetical protein